MWFPRLSFVCYAWTAVHHVQEVLRQQVCMGADITSSKLSHMLRFVVQNGISSEHMSVGEHLHC